MQSLRKFVCKPRVDDWSPLARLYHADERLNAVAAELDALDGRKEPERCSLLMGRLRSSQDRVLQIIEEIMVLIWPEENERAPRDFRAKFPDDILQENLPGQLWFGAECLAAGSNIIEREAESEAIRPLARSLTRHLDKLRELLREQSLRNPNLYPDKVRKNLRVFDHLFAEFELNYVSAMVPVKSAKEYNAQQDVAVLFSETLMRALALGLITGEQIEDCDPSVMITLPRLAIVAGLLMFKHGPLSLDRKPDDMPDMFRPFHALLKKIRNLLGVLAAGELDALELSLCNRGDEVGERPDVALIADYQSSIPLSETNGVSERIDPDTSGEPMVCDDSGKEEAAAVDAAKKKSSRREESLRSRFKSSEDLVHRLFVCVAGVADQLQTNYPADLRAVLKVVLLPVNPVHVYEVSGQAAMTQGNEEELGLEATVLDPSSPRPPLESGVRWVPDEEAADCTACGVGFTFLRRRHHCRNCGHIFCGPCSTNSLPLPELGYEDGKAVRVCNQCFFFKVNPFTSASGAQPGPSST